MRSSTADVVAAVRKATTVHAKSRWSDDENVAYDLVVQILIHERSYNEEDANRAIFEAVMEGQVVVNMAKERSTDQKNSFCLETEN